MAPPTVPGVPAHISSPAHPCAIVQRTSPLIVTPASARMRSTPSCRTSPPCTRITTPRTPRSETRTLEPPPSSVTGTPASRAISSARRTSSARCARTSQSAVPPSLNVVNGASGASRATRSSPSARFSRTAKSSPISLSPGASPRGPPARPLAGTPTPLRVVARLLRSLARIADSSHPATGPASPASDATRSRSASSASSRAQAMNSIESPGAS